MSTNPLTTLHLTSKDLRQAADLLRKGKLVVFPTETVWGLGANALDAAACARIFQAKGRPADNPLIVHIAKTSDAETWALSIPKEARMLMEAFWPGPLTLILPKNPLIPDSVTGGQSTVGLRVPALELARQLILEAGVPLAAPSANPSGRPSPTHFSMAWEAMQGRVEAILEGPSSLEGLESTIVSFSPLGVHYLRPGSISREALQGVLGPSIPVLVGESSPLSAISVTPGSKYPHYRPHTPIRLFEHEEELPFEVQNSSPLGILGVGLGLDSNRKWPVRWKIWNCVTLEELARILFATFHQADLLNLGTLWVKRPQENGIGLAILNRLQKATIN